MKNSPQCVTIEDSGKSLPPVAVCNDSQHSSCEPIAQVGNNPVSIAYHLWKDNNPFTKGTLVFGWADVCPSITIGKGGKSVGEVSQSHPLICPSY